MNNTRTPGVIRFILPKIGDLIFLAGFVCAILLGPRLLNVDGDLGRHLVVGNLILDSRHIPTQDLFSHTMTGQVFTPHEWLSEVAYALFYRWAGLNGVVLLCGLLLGLTFRVLYSALLRQQGRPLLALGLCLGAMAVSSLHWLARPHLFTLLFFVIWLSELERIFRGNSSRWWIFPTLMLFWVNLHGAFIAGFVTWGIYLVGFGWDHWKEKGFAHLTELKYAFAGGVLSLIVSFINPAGLRLWETSLGYLQNQYLVSHTVEYFSPDFHQISAWPFLLMLILTIIAIGLRKGKMSTAGVLSIAAWAGMGLISIRNVPLFGVAAAFGLAQALSTNEFPKTGLEQRLLVMENQLAGWVWPAALILLVIATFGKGIPLDAQQKGNQFDSSVFPVAAVDWMDDHPLTGPGFNYFPWGGYLLYREWPDRKVFIDGQTDFYGETLTRQYETVISAAPGWQSVLTQYSVRWVMIPGNSDLSKALDQSIDWERVYNDLTASIYVHKD